MSVCRSCAAPVVWVVTQATDRKPAKRMPLDATPEGMPLVAESGNLEFTGRTFGDALEVTVVASGRGSFLSHFVTCPQRDEWRKR